MLNSCQAERDFIKQSIMNNIRVDGRRNTGRRSLVIKKEVISHLPGSSYVYIEYENVQIYTGIKIKIHEATDISQPVVLQLTAMRKLSAQETEELERLQCVVQQVFVSKLAASPELLQFLRIEGSKKHKLVLYIDVFLLSSPHLSQVELIVTGIRSALEQTKIPHIAVAFNQVTEQQSVEISNSTHKLSKNDWDQIVVVGAVREGENTHFVIDMKKQQFQTMDACFLLILQDQKVKSLELIKGRASIETINRCVKFIMGYTR